MADSIRVLIADDDYQLSHRLAAYIEQHGFSAKVASNGQEARSHILDWKPRFVLADLMLPDGSALNLIDFIKQESSLKHSRIDVLVTSGHNLESNVRQAFGRGAKDYIVKPFRHEDLLKRLIFHSRSYKKLKELSTKEYTHVDEASLMLHLTDLVLRQAIKATELKTVLYNLTRMVNLKTDGVRCSIIHCLDQHTGYVVSSNDNLEAVGIQLDLYKYPEVLHVLNTQSLIAIENLKESTELRHVAELAQEISFNSMIVCPISRANQPFGVLSLRMPEEKQTLSDNEIRFVEIVSHVVSLVLSNEAHSRATDYWREGQPAPRPLKLAKN